MAANTRRRGTAPKGAQSIHRAIDLLVTVGEHNTTGVRLKDLTKMSGLHPATAHRLLQALQWQRMLSFDSYSKRYFLGVRLHALMDSARFAGIKAYLQETMTRIVAQTGDVVYLYLPLMNDVICVERMEGNFPVRALIRDVGARLPCGIGAGGVAILAAMATDQAKAIVAANAERYPDYNDLSSDKVWRAVLAAKRIGYGLNREQVMAGITGIGMAVHDARGEPKAAITVVSIAKRLDGDRRRQVAEIMEREIRTAEPLPDVP
ncbi:MAG: IclR family transcriptional regulator [Alphaproteobacteria bacterium]|nr:IclR family transcriptional regulator [Alphaproteobacteria bacterium]